MILTYLLMAYLVLSMILVVYYLAKSKKLEAKSEKLEKEITAIKTTKERYKWFVDTLISELSGKELLVVDNENIEYPTFKDKVVVLMGKSVLRYPTLCNSIILFHPETTNSCIICPKVINQSNSKEVKDV